MRTGVNIIGAALAVLMLAGCGGGGKNDTAAEGDAKVMAANDWDASDACALLDRAAVGTALGSAVTETSLAFVNKAEGSNAATSECTYRLANGDSATLMARRSPIGDNSDAAIKQTREATAKTMAAFSDKKIEDVAGLGKAAFSFPGSTSSTSF